jgi:hypothetical protein
MSLDDAVSSLVLEATAPDILRTRAKKKARAAAA